MPRRVRVTSPRRGATHVGDRSRYRDLEEETALGEVYVEAILRAQRRLAISLVACVVLLLVLLPTALVLLPETWTPAGLVVPLPWLLLGVVVYPSALFLTHRFVRAAERIEREFVELMDSP
ncbi:hypothetical protein MOPEL_020_00500 [Mobilicoccus pelagius NBRC 104925]|uniref:Uncharacterized protein n=1 Tax=Mobilicoccus pelagius NBRC 104925 TaxID=1089455 RepID=H5UPA6_9MICO|nr:hypothetical protein MOPEL_020_00500 [Mobilicoccus pelagius NBRC 104925]